jgi:hypothetical protein
MTRKLKEQSLYFNVIDFVPPNPVAFYNLKKITRYYKFCYIPVITRLTKYITSKNECYYKMITKLRLWICLSTIRAVLKKVVVDSFLV